MSSVDLEILGDLPKLRVPSTINVVIEHDKGSDSSRGAAAGEKDDEDGAPVTPTSEEHRIPAALDCPPAPRKPKRKASCKRKLVELEFFEMVNREEVDSFFIRSSFEDEVAKRKCPCK